MHPREVALARASLERLLRDNLLSFWSERALDSRDGGYYAHYDAQGRRRGRADKYLISQTRLLWFFSRLSRSPYKEDAHLRSAQHGYEFLRDRMWDSRHGGFFWQTSSDGKRVVRSEKHLYGQAFGLCALSEYAAATGNTAATDLARALYELIERYARDDVYGGYNECFEREWRELQHGGGLIGVAPGLKSLNTHLHLLEAMVCHATIDSAPDIVLRLREVRSMISEHLISVSSAGACGVETRNRDWTPVRETHDERVSYGHDVETAWLLLDADLAVRDPHMPSLGHARGLFANAQRFGADPRAGGYYESGPAGYPADRRTKVWWVQAEAMLGSLRLYRLTAEPGYAGDFLGVLRWIVDHQVDWRCGEWYDRVDENDRAKGDKAGPWKDPYHTGRAILSCLQLLSEL